jgi:CheY-like chemotaxis protein
MDIAIEGARPLQTVLVCHNNKVLVNIGRIHAERHGLRVIVAKNGNEVLLKARLHRPDMIVLSSDLKSPSTEETIKLLQQDPSLSGIRVVTIKGAIPNLRDMLGRFPGP